MSTVSCISLPLKNLLSSSHALGLKLRFRIISNEPEMVQLNIFERTHRQHRKQQQKFSSDLVIVVLVVELHLVFERRVNLVAWLVVHHFLGRP